MSSIVTLSSRLRESLEHLREVDTNRESVMNNNANVNQALDLIFRIGTEKPTLTEEEKSRLGDLLKDSLKAIKTGIRSSACRYHTRLETAILRRRSALQFLIDDLGDLPAGSSPLSTVLEEENIKGSVEILDKLILRLKDDSDSDEGSSDWESAGASRVPLSHTWWNR